jgi:hypothetical protein
VTPTRESTSGSKPFDPTLNLASFLQGHKYIPNTPIDSDNTKPSLTNADPIHSIPSKVEEHTLVSHPVSPSSFFAKESEFPRREVLVIEWCRDVESQETVESILPPSCVVNQINEEK